LHRMRGVRSSLPNRLPRDERSGAVAVEARGLRELFHLCNGLP
jgi:hypothetical protein